MASENEAVSITVLALGLFLELQVHIRGGDEAEDIDGQEDGMKYSIVPYTKQESSTLTIDHLEKILKLGSNELDKLMSENRNYEVMARDVTVSQGLVLPVADVDDQSTVSLVTPRFAGCTLRERLCIQKFESSTQQEQFEKLSRALGEEIADINSALLAIHRIVMGDGGLEKLKEKLMAVSSNSIQITNEETSVNKGGRHIYLDCIYLLHGLCDVRITVPPTSYNDYLHRLLGFILKYAGVSISSTSKNAELGTFQLTNSRRDLNNVRLYNVNFAGKAMLKCTIYGPDVDVGEIAKSMMPMFVQDNLEPDCLLSLHQFTTQDMDKMTEVIEILKNRCLEMKEVSLVSKEDDKRISMKKFVLWLYSKCQHHQGERLLLYYYTMTGVAKLIRQYCIFASACSHLDEGLFTTLSPKGKEQAVLDQAQKLNIIPQHPLDDIIDKRIWKFIPHSDMSKENGNYYADDESDGHHASRLSFYHQFMTDLVSLLPHTQRYDIDHLKSEIAAITTSDDHDSFWVNMRMTNMNKKSKRSTDMSCGAFETHLCNVPVDMSFINPQLFQFRILFCSNSHACRELKLYTSDSGVDNNTVFQLNRKCKLCFKNALICAVTIYQQMQTAFASLNASTITTFLNTEISSKTRGQGLKKGSSCHSKNGKTRCLVYLKNLIDEFLPAAVIRYLWGRKAMTISDNILVGIAPLKPFPWQQFPWCDHKTCGDAVPPPVNCLLFYAKEIAKQKNIEQHTDVFEEMLHTLITNMFSSSADEDHIVDICINAMIKFFDHITDFAIDSINNKVLDQIPSQWQSKLWPKSKKKRKRENDDSSRENSIGHGTKYISGAAGAGARINKSAIETPGDGADTAYNAHGKNLQRSSIKSRTKLTGQKFILTECESDFGGSDDSEEDSQNDGEEDSQNGDRTQIAEEKIFDDVDEGDDNDEDDISWKSKDGRFQPVRNNIDKCPDAMIHSYKEYKGDKEDPVQVGSSSGSENESVPVIEFEWALQHASKYGDSDFVYSVGKFLSSMSPFTSCGVVSLKITGDQVRHFHKHDSKMLQRTDVGRTTNKDTKPMGPDVGATPLPDADVSASELAKLDGAIADFTPTHLGQTQSKINFSQKNLDSSDGIERQTKGSIPNSGDSRLTSLQQSKITRYDVTQSTMDMLKKKKKK